MRIQQRNVEKIAKRLNAAGKRETQIHEQRIRFLIASKRMVKRNLEFIEEDYIGQNTPNNMPYCAKEK